MRLLLLGVGAEGINARKSDSILSAAASADLPDGGAPRNTSSTFASEKLANTVKDDKRLKLQRARGPLRLILILLGSANLFCVLLHLM